MSKVELFKFDVQVHIELPIQEYRMMTEGQIKYALGSKLLDELDKNGFIRYDTIPINADTYKVTASLVMIKE